MTGCDKQRKASLRIIIQLQMQYELLSMKMVIDKQSKTSSRPMLYLDGLSVVNVGIFGGLNGFPKHQKWCG